MNGGSGAKLATLPSDEGVQAGSSAPAAPFIECGSAGLPDARTNAELKETTASALPWIAFSRAAIEILMLGTIVILARLIPPSAFGVFALAVIVQELAIVVPGEGVGGALVQRRDVTRDHLQAGLAVSLAVALVLGVITLILSATLVKTIFGDDVATLLALTTPWYLLGAIIALPTVVLRRRLDFRRLAQLEFSSTIVRAITSILFATVFGMDAMALMLGGMCGLFAMAVIAVAFARVPLPRWHAAAARDLIPYGLPAAVTSVIWTGFRNGDYAIVGARLGVTQAGLYWRGYQLGVEYQRKVSGILTQVGFPMLSRTLGVEEMFALRQRMVSLATVAVFPPLVLLIVLAPVVVPWLFGDAWSAAVLPTQILAGGGATMMVIDIAGSVILAMGRARVVLIWAIAHFVVYATAVLVVAGYGLSAVCAAAVGSHTFFLILYYAIMVHGRDEKAIPLLWRDVRPAIVGCVALGAVGWPLSHVLGSEGVPTVPRLVLVSCAGMGAYLLALNRWFPDAFRGLWKIIDRIMPTAWVRSRLRRVPALAER